MTKQKVLLILSIVLIGIGGSLLIAGTVLSLLHQNTLADIFLGVSSVLGVVALGLLVYRLTLVAKDMGSTPQPEKPRVVV